MAVDLTLRANVQGPTARRPVPAGRPSGGRARAAAWPGSRSRAAARPRWQPLAAKAATVFAALALSVWAIAPVAEPLVFQRPSGAPARVRVVENLQAGTKLVQHIEPQVADAAFVAWLDGQRAGGWSVIEREPHGSGMYLLEMGR